MTYKVGDYVLLSDDPKNKWLVCLECQIIEKFENIEINYKLKAFYFDGRITNFFVDESEINRKMTPEEIKDFKIKIDTKKYNL